MLEYLPVEYAQPDGSRAVSNSCRLMFIVAECAASQRTRGIIARQRLRANDLGARMEMISRYDLHLRAR